MLPLSSSHCQSAFSFLQRLLFTVGIYRNVRIVFFLSLFFFLVFTFTYRFVGNEPSWRRAGAFGAADRYAITTLLGENTSPNGEDGYFLATRVLTYQLLHAHETRISERNRHRIDWVVMVTAKVSQESRQQLEKDGAIVVQADDVEVPTWATTSEPRWKDVYTKLRVFQWTQYARVLFIDADAMITRPIDGIFEDPDAKQSKPPIRDRQVPDEMPYPAKYLLLARPDNANRLAFNHAVPPDPNTPSDHLNSGFFMIEPSLEMFNHLLHVISIEGRYDSFMPEQNLFNYVFRRDGPMPWVELDWRWHSNFPNVQDRNAGVASLHEKLWQGGAPELRALWDSIRKRMEDYDQGKASYK
ncbi:hypothetical protein CDD83_2724 [Cordyceps sp. RAO-2017]|nr:hypothetical protein CDD83_2724 [Cordyceps sp. RAO-2017]